MSKAEDLIKVAEPIVDDMEKAEIVFLEPESAIESMLKSSMSELASIALLALAANPYMRKFMNERGYQ